MSRASDLAYETIRAKILSGELAPMTQLKEEELAEMCGVSRTPIRDALRRLEADMLVRRTDTQRTFVPDWSPEEVEEIFTLRMLLESHAAGRAARFVTAEEIETLRSYTNLIRDAIEQPDFDSLTFVENNRLFHNLILSIAKSDRLAKIRGMIVEQGILHRTARHYDRAGLRRSHADHEELLMAFEARDEAWASAIMAGHILRAYHVTMREYAFQTEESEAQAPEGAMATSEER